MPSKNVAGATRSNGKMIPLISDLDLTRPRKTCIDFSYCATRSSHTQLQPENSHTSAALLLSDQLDGAQSDLLRGEAVRSSDMPSTGTYCVAIATMLR